MKRLSSILAVIVLTGALARAYYPFLQYVNRDGASIGLPQKFDLANLPNGRVNFFLAGAPEVLAEGDNPDRLLSQLRLAARQWNDVPTSALRIEFGGKLSSPSETQSGPGIDVVFGEVPPGLIALGGPTVLADPAPDAKFVPILRSQLLLPNDMSKMASWSDRTFATLVHEFGHTLGLQHSLTSSAMSTDVSRAVTKGKALATDDVAGISLLYPSPEFQANLGSISGRVALDGSGLSLVSVVAISPRGAAVGTLTAPDGTYRIDGLPAGNYYVYAHPLPPAQSGEATPANIVIPVDSNRTAIAIAGPFNLTFYPAAATPADARAIPLGAAAHVEGIEIAVTARSAAQSIYNVLTYSFPAGIAVRPAHVNVTARRNFFANSNRNFFVATGSGLFNNDSQPLPGLTAAVLGGSTTITGIKHYSSGYLQFDLGYTPEVGDGTRHLVFSRQGETYIQPGALTLTTAQPPNVGEITADSASSVAIVGSDLGAETKVFFDGAPAAVESYDTDAGRLTVRVPPSSQDHRALVLAVNPDGQSSSFLQSYDKTMLTLPGSVPFGATVLPAALRAGLDAGIEIDAPNANFVPEQVTIGFGTSDIVVKRVAVASPSRLIAQVQIRPTAPVRTYNLTIYHGLQVITQPSALTVTEGVAAQAAVSPKTPNPVTGLATAAAGESFAVTIGGTAANLTATLGGIAAPVQIVDESTAMIQIPAEIAPGLAILKIASGDNQAVPIAVEVTPAPLQPALVGESSVPSGTALTVSIPEIRKRLSPFATPRIGVTVAGVPHLATVSSTADELKFTLLPSVPAGETTIEISLHGVALTPVTVTILP